MIPNMKPHILSYAYCGGCRKTIEDNHGVLALVAHRIYIREQRVDLVSLIMTEEGKDSHKPRAGCTDRHSQNQNKQIHPDAGLNHRS